MKGLSSHASRPERSALEHQGVLAPWSAFSLAAIIGAGALVSMAEMVLGLPAASQSVVVATLVYLAASALGAYAIHRTYPHDSLGLCNLATLARMVIVSVLAVAALEGIAPGFALLGLAFLSLSLDGVDGWLARKQGLSSDFGARFDVEVDAAFALLLTLYAARTGIAAPYVILLGVPYYLFWIARTLLPWLNAPLPERFSRKAVCVAQIATLILLLVPQLAGSIFLNVLVGAVALALIWSFGRDISWLYRSRA